MNIQPGERVELLFKCKRCGMFVTESQLFSGGEIDDEHQYHHCNGFIDVAGVVELTGLNFPDRDKERGKTEDED